jgi:glycosyltransferase involved in cell wall biosynthesis
VTRLGFPASRGVASFAAVEYVEGVAHHRLWVPGLRRYTALPADEQVDATIRALGVLVDRVRPAVLWAATPHLNGLAGLALRNSRGVPLVYDVRGFPELTWEAEHGGPSELSAARQAAETRLMIAADRVVTLGTVMRERIRSRGIDNRKIIVAPHVVETKAGRASDAATDLPVVGLATTLRRYEGVDELLRAVATVRSRGLSVRPLILGDGPELAALRELAAVLRFDPLATLPGRVPPEDAARHLRTMAVVAMPRRNEPVCRWVVPLKPLEAMAGARPLILSRLPALEEIGGAGRARLVRPEDPEALAAAIAADLADPAGRAARAEGALEWVSQNHSPAELDAAMRRALADLGLPLTTPHWSRR